MRNTLLTIVILTALAGGNLSAGDGWGTKQTSRTIGGVLSGATIGGIIGHQHDKQKEGIIIGSVLGMIIGNQSGKGRDVRNERQRQEQIQREQAHQRELQRREQERQNRAAGQFGNGNSDSPVHGQVSYEDKVLMEAQLRAEKAERELQAELERQRQVEERRRALAEYRERERQARERLLRAKGYTPENYPNLFQ